MFDQLKIKFARGIRSILYKEWMKGISFFGGEESSAGESVTVTTALNLSAVWGATQFLARTMAALPLKVFKITDSGKEPDKNHPLYRLLYLQPNPEMTAYQWRSLIMVNVCLLGNHYCEIQRNRGGKIIALWPLPNNRVTFYRDKDKQLKYKIKMDNGNDVILQRHQVLHLKGLSEDGLGGMSVISAARETFGLALAGQKSASKFYKNGSQLTGLLEHPGTGKLAGLSDDSHKRIIKSWEDSHKGLDQAHRIALLEEGMTFRPISISPQDAQLLGSRKFSNEEIARFFGIPLHKIQHLDKATNNNIEHQSIELVTDAILPYAVNFEQEFQVKLFSKDEFKTHFPKHVLQGLLRGDTKTRFEGYHIAKLDGWMSADDIRSLEDMNDLPNGLGKKYYIPMNFAEIEKLNKGDSNAK